MSSQKKSSRLEGKDLITIGIYTVIYVVIVMLVAMLGFIPIFIPLMAVLCPLIGGIPYCRVDGQGFGFVLPDEADKLREFFAEHQDKPALENPSGVS